MEGLCGEALLEVGPTGERPQLSGCTDGRRHRGGQVHCELSLAAVWKAVMMATPLLCVSSLCSGAGSKCVKMLSIQGDGRTRDRFEPTGPVTASGRGLCLQELSSVVTGIETSLTALKWFPHNRYFCFCLVRRCAGVLISLFFCCSDPKFVLAQPVPVTSEWQD